MTTESTYFLLTIGITLFGIAILCLLSMYRATVQVTGHGLGGPYLLLWPCSVMCLSPTIQNFIPLIDIMSLNILGNVLGFILVVIISKIKPVTIYEKPDSHCF